MFRANDPAKWLREQVIHFSDSRALIAGMADCR
jgi:hypothetical protein